MKIRRILYAVFAICVAAAFPIVLWAGVASAQVSSGCTVTFNGGNANTYSSPGSALEVDKDSVVRVQGRSAGTVTGHHIELEFAGVRWTVSSGADNGATWGGIANVKKYAKYGVGIYKVVGASTGPGACTGSAFVKVTGRNPLTTAAGAGAAAVTAVGVVGLAYATARSGYGTSDMDNIMNVYDQAVPPSPPKPEMTDDQAIKNIDDEVRSASGGWFSLCLLALPRALLSTMALMVAGAGAPGAPGGRPLPRVRWHPRISILGLVAGLLTGLGALVLLQQYAIVYPTRTVAIVMLAAGLVVGLVLPSIRRLFATRKLNRTLASRSA